LWDAFYDFCFENAFLLGGNLEPGPRRLSDARISPPPTCTGGKQTPLQSYSLASKLIQCLFQSRFACFNTNLLLAQIDKTRKIIEKRY